MSDLPASLIALHVLGAVGFVVVVTMGLITTPIRERWQDFFRTSPMWGKMLYCPMCFGVWGGAGWAALLLLRPHIGALRHVHDVLAFAFAVSLLGFGVALCESLIGRLGPPKAPKE